MTAKGDFVSIDATTCVISTSHTVRCDVKSPRVRVRIRPIPKTNETECRFDCLSKPNGAVCNEP